MAQEWSGFYLGANLGGVWGNSDVTTGVDCPGNGVFCSPPLGANNGPAVAAAGTGSGNGDGVIGGAQAGYNVQSGSFVYGFEIDLSALDLNSSRETTGTLPTAPPGPFVGTTFTIGSALSTNWLMTARGRLGWAVSNLLLYASGGLAVTDLKLTSTYRDNITNAGVGPGTSMFASNTDTKVGFAVGGGLEWVLTGNWTLRGEYLYVDFGSVTATGFATNPVAVDPTANNPIAASVDLSEHIGRAGFNYRFQTPN
jgi:outer membrane immunogenic protein